MELIRTGSPLNTGYKGGVSVTATHVVEYKEKATRTKALVGKVAIEFSPENYGPGNRGEWWLLLEPCLEPAPAAGGS